MLDHEDTIGYISEEVERVFDLPKDEALHYTAFILDTHQSMRNEGLTK